MQKIQERKVRVLKYIVEEYLKTGDILGSKNLLKKYDLQVSSATIRNDMAALEEMGLVFQPYNSAGRLPTTRGLRVFVDYLMESMPHTILSSPTHPSAHTDDRIDDQLHRLVSQLTQTTGEITFACIPSLRILKYLGLSHYLDNHDEIDDGFKKIIKSLESKESYMQMLSHLELSSRVHISIGDENPISDLKHTTLLVKKIEISGYQGYLGIIGSTMMDYAFNINALRQVL